MNESVRQTLNNYYTQRDPRSGSPSTGKLHKQRQSFGPTVCLISKNPQVENEISNDKLKILMLILQIQRLNQVVASLISSTKNIKISDQSQESQFLKKQIISLKSNLQRTQKEKYQQIERQNRVIYANSNKINQYETQMKLNNRRIGQLEDTNNGLLHKLKLMEEQIGRAKSEASRANMNVLMNTSQTQLQKSMIRQKSIVQMQLWKQKLVKYENMINEQKQFINSQKVAIDKLHNNQLQIKQRYEYDMSMMKKNNQDLGQKCQRLERQLNANMQSSSIQANRQLSLKQRELQQLRQKLSQSNRQIHQLRNNLENVSKSKEQITQQMRGVITELRQSLQEMNEHFHDINQKHDKCKGQVEHLMKQNQNLRNKLGQINKNYSTQINDLQQEILSKNDQVRRLQKNTKRLKQQNKMKKSYSQSNLRPNTSTSLRHIKTADIGGIIQDVIQLQDSNMRVNRILESSKSLNQVTQYRNFSLTNYGL